jgi:iron-sulfur cluster assembly enzyme ISCU, mitochondrial
VTGVRVYYKRVVDHYNNLRSVGSFDKDGPNVGTNAWPQRRHQRAPACGEVMKLQIHINEGTARSSMTASRHWDAAPLFLPLP